VTRAGAQSGDALVLTGELGGAAAGLLLLEDEARSPFVALSATNGERMHPLISRQLEPRPRLDAGRGLAAAGATAMIDLSDGLGGDAGHLARASAVGLRIDGDALPIEGGVTEVAMSAGRDPLELATSGGEDYELLATLPAARLAEATAGLETQGTKLTRIGAVVAGEGVEIRLPDGGLLEPRGFDQLG